MRRVKRQVSGEEGHAASLRVLKAIDSLSSVAVADLECHARKPPADEMTLLVELRAKGRCEDEVVLTRSEYVVTAVDDEADEANDDNTVWTVSVSLVAQWLRRPGAEITRADVQCFAMGQGALSCHPYAREVVQSAASRMNYPPVTLDLIFNPWIDPDGTEIEIPDDADQVDLAAH